MHDRAAIGVSAIDAVSADHGALHGRRIAGHRGTGPQVFVMQFAEGTDLLPIMEAYKATGLVANVERDAQGSYGGGGGFIPNDAHYNKQWGLHNDGTFSLFPAVAGADIDMEAAWGIEQGSDAITVAIIDTGTRLQHPDIAARLWVNPGETDGNATDDDGNGYVDDMNGWDFANDDNITTDDHGHGTNVAGIVGAIGNNEIGFAGVDLNCRIMSLKALGADATGWYTWWIAAIYYAVDNGAHVINMSLGGSSPSPEMQTAVDHAIANQVTVVACMMNTNSSTPFIPAALNGVLAVGATSPNDHRAVPFPWSPASGSNYGSHINVVAPGNYVYSLNYGSNTNYTTYWSGTSQASPHAAGLVSLLLAQDPTRTPQELISIIENTAEDQVGNPAEDTPGWDQYHGHGRINAFQALLESVSVEDRERLLPALTVYPNPGTGWFNVRTNTVATIQVFDDLGRLVHERRTGMGVERIDAGLPAGVYTVRALSEAGPATARLVVQ